MATNLSKKITTNKRPVKGSYNPAMSPTVKGPTFSVPEDILDEFTIETINVTTINEGTTGDGITIEGVLLIDNSVDFPTVGTEIPAVGVYKSASNVLTLTTAGSDRVSIDAQGDINIAGGRGIDSNVANVKVPFIAALAQNDIAAGTGGAIAVTNYLTTINTDAGGDAFTLAAGAVIGQLKKILLVVDGGGDAVVTAAFPAATTTLTFNDAGEFALLMWDGTDWQPLQLGSEGTFTDAPVIS